MNRCWHILCAEKARSKQNKEIGVGVDVGVGVVVGG